MKTFAILALAALAAAEKKDVGGTEAVEERATVEFKKGDVAAKLHLNTNGELEMTADECIDPTNFCDRADSTRASCTLNPSATATGAGIRFGNPGSDATATIELYTDGTLRFTVSDGGCVDVDAGELSSYDNINGLVLDNQGTQGAVRLDTSGAKPYLRVHTASVHTSVHSLQPCDIGYAGTTSCTACNGAEEYQNEAGKATCKTATLCAGSVEQDEDRKDSSDRTCKCTAGYANYNSGTNSCTACSGAEQYQNEAGKATCKTATLCAGSVEQEQDRTDSSDRTCKCTAGYVNYNSGDNTCTAIKCSSISLPTHAELKVAADTDCFTDCDGSSGTCFQCKDGFSGAQCNKCAAGKGYNATTQTCDNCARPEFNAGDTHDAACALQECDAGQGVTGDGDTWDPTGGNCETCQTGHGSPQGSGQCAPKTCTKTSVPNSVSFADANSIQGVYGDQISVACAEGYTGDGTATCDQDGDSTPSFTTPSCDALKCDSVTVPTHGTYKTDVDANTECLTNCAGSSGACFECTNGYSGENCDTCESGKWIDASDNNKCKVATSCAHASVVQDQDVTASSDRTCKCAAGHSTYVLSTNTCTEDTCGNLPDEHFYEYKPSMSATESCGASGCGMGNCWQCSTSCTPTDSNYDSCSYHQSGDSCFMMKWTDKIDDKECDHRNGDETTEDAAFALCRANSDTCGGINRNNDDNWKWCTGNDRSTKSGRKMRKVAFESH